EVNARNPHTMSGCSLMPLLQDPQEQNQWIEHCGYSISEIAVPGAYPVVAVRTAHFKYIHFEHRQDEFYDLDTDPGEHHNLYAEGGKVMDGFRRIAMNVVAKRRENKKGRVELNQGLIRRLKALGYMQ
ncbi:MAG TPA: sulfatase/phosphatase domain-containing protein, partial [Thermoanaerobaculia bacterium]|nr:sulfatase/phosphatase domain-containing protein [Thermoanaerobaculia bacterium]